MRLITPERVLESVRAVLDGHAAKDNLVEIAGVRDLKSKAARR
jgi:hypothetical protein